jgi:transcriptional regulator with GAF, ATPase, and Fis domain
MPVLPDAPPRETVGWLTEEACALGDMTAIGVSQALDASRVAVFWSCRFGMGSFTLAEHAVPHPLRPAGDDDRQLARDAMTVDSSHVVEWQLDLTGFRHLVSAPLPGIAPVARLWIGLADTAPPSSSLVQRFHDLAASASSRLVASRPTAGERERLERLERASAVLPALFRSLDVREVFDRLSTIGQAALRHDSILLSLWEATDISRMTVYAAAGLPVESTVVRPRPYPASWTEAVSFELLDDRTLHPLERDRFMTTMGARTSLRFPIRFGGRAIGGVSFNRSTPDVFSSDDVAVGRRLAEYVGMALSHQSLAEEQRQSAAIRERTASLETLDALLGTLSGVLDIRDVFDRVSEIGKTVMPHDAMTILVPTDTPGMARVHASTGLLGRSHLPPFVAAPRPELLQPGWDHLLVEDLHADPVFADSPGARAGMRSVLAMPISLEGQLRGSANFLSREPYRFSRADLPMARRIADHVALALSHQRLADQIRSTEELRTRTTNIELLDELLTTLVDSGELAAVFDRISAIARKVLPHDAMFIAVFLADGRHATRYVISGVDTAGIPQVIEMPEELCASDWDHQIVDDLTVNPPAALQTAIRLGFRSALRIPIRLDGRLLAILSFGSKSPSAFGETDVMVGRRIADRVALSLARERGVEATRRADEATVRAARLEARVRALSEELDARTGFRRVVGESQPWRRVLTQATQVAPTETTVLLLGESGTGKEVIARFLHRASPRATGPFVALNCAALPEQLLEAELFGYERGAYTGATQSKPGQLEQAAGGTLFLDEVGEMSPSVQAKFLRVLQEREFQRLGGTRVLRTDARIVAATNRDLPRAIAQGQFREDLYYRLNVFAIRLPALRERPDDILPLSEVFLAEVARGLARPPAGISRDARKALTGYPWPGNVRELRNILERAAILCEGGLITTEHLALLPPVAPAVQDPAPAAAQPAVPAPPAAAAARGAADISRMERAMIEQALQDARFNKSKAAKALGLTRQQLYVRLRRYGLE